MSLLRIDASTLSAPERTDEGYLRAEGIVAPAGVLKYRTKSGKTVSEYVPEETLKDPEFLESLEDKPVTLEHPPEMVDPDNVSDYAVGNVRDVEWSDEESGVKAAVILRDRDAIEAFEDGTDELSPAYEVELDDSAGRNEHGDYDRVQAKRRAGNHVALTEAGRAGAKARLRADSDAVQADWTNDDEPMSDDSPPNDDPSPRGDAMPEKVRLDSERTITVDEQDAQILRTWKQDQEDEQLELSSEIESAQSQVEQFKETITELEEERDELQKQIESKKKQLKRLGEKLGLGDMMGEESDGSSGGSSEPGASGGPEASGEPAADMESMPRDDEKLDSLVAGRIDSLCRERMDALEAAEAVGLEVDEDTPTTDIKADVVEKYFDDRSPDRADSTQVDAYFQAAVDMLEERSEEREESIRSANERTDSNSSDPDAREQYRRQVFG